MRDSDMVARRVGLFNPCSAVWSVGEGGGKKHGKAGEGLGEEAEHLAEGGADSDPGGLMDLALVLNVVVEGRCDERAETGAYQCANDGNDGGAEDGARQASDEGCYD